MYQEPTRRLSDLSERCHVRKFACLLARPLRVPAQKVALSTGGDPLASGWFSSLSQGRSPERIAIYILRTFLLVEDVPSGELERLGRGKAGAPPPRRRVPPLLLHLTP